MRISRMLRVCSGLLSGLLVLLASCAKPSSQSLQSLSITATPSTVSVGGAVVLRALAHFSNGTSQDVSSSTQWTVSNPTLATITNGVLTSQSAGVVSVQGAFVEVVPVTSSAASTTTAAQTLSSSTQVTITAAGTTTTTPTITWSAPAAITYGTALSSTQLDAQASVQGNFVYSPAAGTVLQAGSQTLTATFTPADTQHNSAAAASVQLTVLPGAAGTPIAPTLTWITPAPIASGTPLSSVQLNAMANVAGAFVYTPSAGTVLQPGTQTLSATFTPVDTMDYTVATATVQIVVSAAPSIPVAPVVPAITWTTPASITQGTPLSSAQLDATAVVAGTFVYAPAAGTLLAPGTQTLTTTFTPADTIHYLPATATVQIAVVAASPAPVNRTAPAITWSTPAPIAQGTALSLVQLDAAASVPGTFAYAPATGTVLQAGTQTLTTTFTPTDITDYLTVTASVQINVLAAGPAPVNPVAPVITWSTPAAIVYGTSLSGSQLNAAASVPGTFAYTPAAGTVIQAGSQTLTTTFTPADTTDYSIATATVSLTVTQANPVISWNAPAAIAQGTALSNAQLNATANVAGAFTYLPQAGTVPAAGTVQLTATFAPADAIDYTAATAQKSLIVNGASDPAPAGCGGPTINLNPGMSQSTLQSTIKSAPNCALIVFAAGTYNITAGISVPCGANLTLTGPATTPATAILSALPSLTQIFYISGCSGITIEYLGFANTTGIYANVPTAGSSGITISHNQFFGLSGTAADQLAETGIYFTGYSTGGTLSNVVVSWNNFGSATDCNGVMTEREDQGGYCSGLVFTASLNNILVSNNTFFHLEEGFHVNCTLPGCVPPTSDTWKNFTAENNDFNQIHRIGMEMQIQQSSNIVIQYNDEHDFVAPYYSTMGISSACCNNGATSPGTIDSNNVVIANDAVDTSVYPPETPYAMEFWGNGAVAHGNLVQGNWRNGIAWGYAPNAIITDNTVCGPVMALGNTYIANEEHQATPTIAPNTTSPTCSAVTSTAPTISPASGTVSGLTTVTLNESGVNHSIYYTLDGTTPTTSSSLYTGSFAVVPGTTVNAIGMWGQGANAKSYPAGYGYVPSGVASATYLDGSVAKPAAAKAAASTSEAAGARGTTAAAFESITVTPAQAVVAIGSSTQLKAVANYSDGTAADITSQCAWASSDLRTITANAAGLISGVATGNATISGAWQGHIVHVPASSSVGELSWSGPILITQGGTYSGNWQSSNADTAAVTIATTDVVVIENAHLRSEGTLIQTDVAGANLTIRNSAAVALRSTVKSHSNGEFLEVTSPARLDVENNYFENVSAGVVVHGYSGKRDGESNIVIRANRGRNINGGSLNPAASFVELDQLQSVPGIDIGWNEVINYPGSSLVGDNIHIHGSSGTANQPLEIHDLYIQGAYALAPSLATYDGGGIRIDGGLIATAASAFNSVHDNQIVATGSHGIAFDAGNDNLAFNNRLLSSGLLLDGTRLSTATVGLVNGAKADSYNNAMRDNLIGWMCWACKAQSYRNDAYFPGATRDYLNNRRIAAHAITLDMEQSEYLLWLGKITSAGVSVGPSF